MTATALGLVLVAALLHAVWNLLAKRAGGGPVLVWLYGTISTALLTPMVIVLFAIRPPEVGSAGLGYLLASAVIHVLYFVVLQRGYQLGDLSVVYPIARGTGPVLTTIGAVVLLGEHPSVQVLSGAVLVALSVFALARPTEVSTGHSRRAVAFGLLTGVLIGSYTLCDKQAVGRYGVPPLLQQWGTCVGLTTCLASLAVHRRDEVRRRWRSHWREVIAIGVLVPLAYILILVAMRFTPVSYVAPAREVSILIATLLGTHVLSEGRSARRIAAAATMVVGVVALALG